LFDPEQSSVFNRELFPGRSLYLIFFRQVLFPQINEEPGKKREYKHS